MTDLTSDLRRRRAPGLRKILKVVKRSALRKARSVPSFDARRNSLTTNRDVSLGVGVTHAPRVLATPKYFASREPFLAQRRGPGEDNKLSRERH